MNTKIIWDKRMQANVIVKQGEEIDHNAFSMTMVEWSLTACMRQYRVTIRELAKTMGITMKRVRQIRDSQTVRYLSAWDCIDGVRQAAAKRLAQ